MGTELVPVNPRTGPALARGEELPRILAAAGGAAAFAWEGALPKCDQAAWRPSC